MNLELSKPRSTVLVAHPSPLILAGLVALVDSGPFQIVAQCHDGEQMLRQVADKNPNIALLDMHLEKLYTLEAVRQLRLHNSAIRIAVLTDGSPREVVESLRVGVNGIFLPTSTSSNLFEGFTTILSGKIYLAPQLKLDRILPSLQSGEFKDPMSTLSAREHQVFAMMTEGIRPKEIANRLQLSAKTIDTYRASLMRKLDIYDLVGLVKLAINIKSNDDSMRMETEVDVLLDIEE